MSIQDHIIFSANQNNGLLHILAKTDYAVSAIEQNNLYMHSLQEESAGLETTIKDLQVRVAGAKYDYEEYRNSKLRRLAYRIGGRKEKFDENAEREEKEYLKLLQQEVESQRNLDLLKEKLLQAAQINANLQSVYNEHRDAQARLDMLYDSIFDGVTPDFPEEDAKEGPRREAQQKFNMIQLHLSGEEQALAILNDADKCLKLALSNLGEALNGSKISSREMANGFVDMLNRSPLSRAQSYASQVEMLYSQARRIVPSMPPLPRIEIAKDNNNIIDDISMYNDNFFIDMLLGAFDVFTEVKSHHKTKDSYAQLVDVQKILDEQILAAQQRVASVRTEVHSAKAVLEQLRSELQAIRAEAFEKIAGRLPPANQNSA